MAWKIVVRYLGEVNYAKLLELRFSGMGKQFALIKYGLSLFCIYLAML
jgi:hypothetical protein